MSGNRKNSKGKGREKDQGDTSAFQVDLSREKGKAIYIPGSFWGLEDADAEKLWECSVFQYDGHYKFSEIDYHNRLDHLSFQEKQARLVEYRAQASINKRRQPPNRSR